MSSEQKSKIFLLESCHKCGQVIREEWNYCPKCETKLNTNNCPFCDTEIKLTWEYCPHCKRNIKEHFNRDFSTANEWLRSILNNNKKGR